MSRSIENEQTSSTGLCSRSSGGKPPFLTLRSSPSVDVSNKTMIENLNNRERTHSCGALRKENVGQRATLMGWCARRRDFGPLTFIDLRDRDGITQIVVNQEKAPDAHAKAKDVRNEYVLAVIGDVVLRDESTRNPKLSTGDVEVQASEILILNDARSLPFQLDAPSSEELMRARVAKLRRDAGLGSASEDMRERVGELRRLASEDLRLKYR